MIEDPNGNVTDDGTYLYAYDAFNRLIAVRRKSNNLLLSQHFYDASGERAATIFYGASGAAERFTQYLREGPLVVYEKTWSLPNWTPLGEKTYLYAEGKMAVTRETLAGVTTTSYYATDHLGTVRAVVSVDASGVEKSRSLHDYEPYGLEIVPLQTSPNTHRFTGHERDVLDAVSNTTLDYMHFRYYGSNMGRFKKPDNIPGNLGNPQSWNLYAYVRGNPVTALDPDGHDTVLSGQTYKVSDPANSTAAKSSSVVQNGNVTTITATEVVLRADSSGNYTKTTTTQTTTITKTSDGKEHSFTGKAQVTVEKGKSEALGKMVRHNEAVANQDLNGPGQKAILSAESLIQAATGGSVVSTGEARGVTAATEAAFKALDPHTSQGPISWKTRVDWFFIGAGGAALVMSGAGEASAGAALATRALSGTSLGWGAYRKIENEGLVP